MKTNTASTKVDGRLENPAQWGMKPPFSDWRKTGMALICIIIIWWNGQLASLWCKLPISSDDDDVPCKSLLRSTSALSPASGPNRPSATAISMNKKNSSQYFCDRQKWMLEIQALDSSTIQWFSTAFVLDSAPTPTPPPPTPPSSVGENWHVSMVQWARHQSVCRGYLKMQTAQHCT